MNTVISYQDPDPRANDSGRALRDRRYNTSERGKLAVSRARTRYENSKRGWSAKQIRRMRYRCGNPGAKMYLRYGGRGIACGLTIDTLVNLIGDGPYLGMCIHRIDNDGDYRAGNIVLLTPEQHRAVHNDGCPV